MASKGSLPPDHPPTRSVLAILQTLANLGSSGITKIAKIDRVGLIGTEILVLAAAGASYLQSM